jgi:molecular chaperone HscB
MTGMTYFSLFSLPRHLNIDLVALEKAFYAQSRRLHPDRFASRPPEEQAEALARSSALNDAYRTLRDPVARTEYLLGLEGVQLEEQSRQATDAARASGGEKKQIAPPDLLEEAFELNMQLEEMRFAKQAGEKDEAIEKDLETARTRFTAMLTEIQDQLQVLWNRWDAAENGSDDAGPAPGTPWSPCCTVAHTYVTWSATSTPRLNKSPCPN